MITSYKLEESVKAEIHEHIIALQELGQIHHIPLFFTMAIGSNEEETVYDKGILTAQSLGMKLKDDTVRKHLLVEAGYDLIPPRENITMDMEEIFDGK